jgi:integrase
MEEIMNTLGNENDTFRQWGELWYSNIQIGVSKSQCVNLRCNLKHLYRFIGDMPIKNIKAYNIDNIISELATNNPNTLRPMGKKSLRDIKNTASRVFDNAIENEVCCINPAHNRKIPKRAPQGERRALTLKEQKLIINTTHAMRIAVIIMMLAGLRRGELIPLLWEDIDIDNFKITINKSVEQTSSNVFSVKKGTKTDKYGRVVEIPIDLAIEIEEAKKTATSKYVCCKADGRMHTPTTWKRMWASYIRAISKKNRDAQFTEISEITPHYLRHTYATLLYMSGVDVLTAAKLLGHSDVRTTIAIYTHLEKMMVDKSVEKLDNYISSSLFGGTR